MGTTWVFDTHATPGSQNTQPTLLTQAQSQEIEGTGNSTKQGTLPPTSPNDEARGSSAPAALFVFEGRDAGGEEDRTQRDGQGRTNDATQGETGPGEEAHTTDQDAANHTPTMDPVELDVEEDTAADRKLRAVYGDTIHQSDGRHLDGGTANDTVWQARYDAVVANPHQLYLPPQGKIGAEVVSLMAYELCGVRERKWNSERPLILLACILRRKHGCVKAKEIKKRITTCIDLWRQGKYDALIHDITTTSLANAGYRSATNDAETMAWKYHSTVLDG